MLLDIDLVRINRKAVLYAVSGGDRGRLSGIGLKVILVGDVVQICCGLHELRCVVHIAISSFNESC